MPLPLALGALLVGGQTLLGFKKGESEQAREKEERDEQRRQIKASGFRKDRRGYIRDVTAARTDPTTGALTGGLTGLSQALLLNAALPAGATEAGTLSADAFGEQLADNALQATQLPAVGGAPVAPLTDPAMTGALTTGESLGGALASGALADLTQEQVARRAIEKGFAPEALMNPAIPQMAGTVNMPQIAQPLTGNRTPGVSLGVPGVGQQPAGPSLGVPQLSTSMPAMGAPVGAQQLGGMLAQPTDRMEQLRKIFSAQGLGTF